MRPRVEILVTLFCRAGQINWSEGELVSKIQLEAAIEKSGGLRLPNGILPALSPGDVVALLDGTYWIDRDWNVIPIQV